MSKSEIDSEVHEIKQIFKELAERKNPLNEYRYAELLEKTAWTKQDFDESYKWYLKAAEHGNPEAMVHLATLHKIGIHVPKDVQLVEKFLLDASKCDYPKAQQMLADLYYEGKILEKNNEKAFYYYLKSAKLGLIRSQFQVATMLNEGIGTVASKNEADKWYKIFAHSNIIMHQLWAADILKYSKLSTKLNSFDLYKSAANNFNSAAMVQLANLYKDGTYCTPNLEKAGYWYAEAAHTYGWTKAPLADLYYRGYIVNQDFLKSAELYKNCLQYGDAIAAYRLGCLMEEGKIPKEDRDYFEYAIEKGSREALIKKQK